MIDLCDRARHAIDTYASQGVDALHSMHSDLSPIISHICFKFTDQDSYQLISEQAAAFGIVTRETFNNKEIAWLCLDQPIKSSGFTVNWLEMVEPKENPHPENDVAAIVYYTGNIPDVVKIPSDDDKITLRFQPRWVQPVISTK